MKLEQHIYTVKKDVFTTVGATSGIQRGEQIELGMRSQYVLPYSFLYNKLPKPAKHVFYPLDEKRLVVGRAVYLDIDDINIKRVGCYLFHNFIISKEDMRKLDCNPVQLIQWLEAEGKFLGKFPEEPQKIEVLDVPWNKLEIPRFRFSPASRDLIMKLLYFCSCYETVKSPLSLIGTDKECLAFLGWLYSIIPYNLREKLSFDTYSYDTNLGRIIIGIPDGAEFQQSISYAMQLNLSNQHYTVNVDLKEISQLMMFIADMAAAGKVDEINALYQLESFLNKGDYSSFKEGYKAATVQIKDFVYASQRRNMLGYIVSQKDTELLHILTDKIGIEEMSVLSSKPEIVEELIRIEDRRITKVFIDWFMKQTRRSQFYPFLFEYPHLWNAFLDEIKPRQQDIPPLLELMKAFPPKYSEPCEASFLDKMIQILPFIREDKKLTREFIQVFSNLPKTSSEDILLMRTFVKYELSDDPSLLKDLVGSNTCAVSERYRGMIEDSILKGIIRTCKPDEIQGYFTIHFDKALDKQAYISKQLDSLERFEISEKTKKMLKDIFLELVKILPQDEKIEKLKGRIGLFVGQKSSFFGKIFGDKIK